MKLIPTSVTRAVAQQVLTAKRNSPHIFFAGGVIGVVGGAVLACRATLKLDETLDDISRDVTETKLRFTDDRTVAVDRQRTQELTRVYVKAGLKVGRLYGPSVVVGSLSIAALTGSHVQLTRRNAALSATLAAVMKSYDEYRERVREELGEEKELDIHRGLREEKNDKKEIVKVVSQNGLSQYAALFDETTTLNWKSNSEYNLIFLRMQQNWCNDKLQAQGYLLLNDVFDALGLDRTTAGTIVGWAVDRNGNTCGDGYVDFGIFEAINDNFVRGWEPSLWLDFNVDGPVNELIDRL